MRAKKLLPLILLAVGALFLLSSCDAILDAIYANNTLDVTVDVSHFDTGYANPSSYVEVTLTGASGASSTANANTIYTGNYSTFDVPFSKLPNGNLHDNDVTYYGYSSSFGLLSIWSSGYSGSYRFALRVVRIQQTVSITSLLIVK